MSESDHDDWSRRGAADPFAGEVPATRRFRKKPALHYTGWLVPVQALAAAGLMGLAAPALLGAEGLVDHLKCGLLTVAAAAVVFGVNRTALDRGAPYAAMGSRLAMGASLSAMLVVGAGTATATFGGLTIEKTGQARMEAFGAEQAAYAEAQGRVALEAAQAEAALQSIIQEIEETARCEKVSSCVSRSSQTGEGPVHFALHGAWQRAGAVATQLREGLMAADHLTDQLEALNVDYARVVADETLDPKTRRGEAQRLATRISQAAAGIGQAAPVALLRGYAEELERGVAVPGNPEAAARIGRMMQGHADGLKAVLGEIRPVEATLPAFPSQTGVADTLSEIGRFLPLAILLLATEIALPLLLWTLAFVSFRDRLAREEEAEEPAPAAPRRGRPAGTRRGEGSA